jgi:hypothetical protein
MAILKKIGKEFKRVKNRIEDNPLGAALGLMTGGVLGGSIGAALGAAAGASLQEDLTAPPDALPDLVDEGALNAEAVKILEEERTRRKKAPGLRSQTVLTSQRGRRPSLLSE